MHYVYVLHSQVTGRFYIGSTKDLGRRLEEHNRGQTTSTRSGRPWKLVYKEEFESKSRATFRERYLKRQKSRKFLEELIELV